MITNRWTCWTGVLTRVRERAWKRTLRRIKYRFELWGGGGQVWTRIGARLVGPAVARMREEINQ